jgi:hypothetical protein
MIGETLLGAVTCQPESRKFLWWNWMAETHNWAEICRWKEPLHYGTDFVTLKQCVKCWEKRIEHNEQWTLN